ncbi:MAG TPA: hypothetical protein ENO36_03135 [Fervidicoccus fontis]|uniref:Cobalamin biosynthesis protein CbiM n=1 Tax=Fervidicoccus fontis TaxID=683846 RepID=A0A7C2YZP2_9CREN|nr:hypothetical protein [Fervidicoccus fontis]
MHIPDGYLSENVWITCYAVSLPVIAFAYFKLKKKWERRKSPCSVS